MIGRYRDRERRRERERKREKEREKERKREKEIVEMKRERESLKRHILSLYMYLLSINAGRAHLFLSAAELRIRILDPDIRSNPDYGHPDSSKMFCHRTVFKYLFTKVEIKYEYKSDFACLNFNQY